MPVLKQLWLTLKPGIVGFANVRTVCRTAPNHRYKTAIVEYFRNDLATGVVYFHKMTLFKR